MDINLAQAAKMLRCAADILIIAHKSPDGDTLGSSFALCRALLARGRRVRVECSDPIPDKYRYLFPESEPEPFEPRFIAAVDVADTRLFGKRLESYGERVDLCVDHHLTNTDYARFRCIDPDQAATAQIMYGILLEMGADITPQIADCLFTGISTDTGCFRYANVTAVTHRMAASLLERGARGAAINEAMFERKSRSRVQAELRAMQSLAFEFDGRCAMIFITREMLSETGASDAELDGISAMPRRIEGVWAGVTLREQDGGYRISVRTNERVDAAALCAGLGGGGHARAAGCFLPGKLDEVLPRLRAAIGAALA